MRVVLGVALVGLVACVGCGREPESPHQRAEPIASIEKLGEGVVFIFSDAHVVNLQSTKVTDAELVHLKVLNNLTYLLLAGTKVTDAGLVHLSGLTNLRTLTLNGTKVTDAELVHLKGMTKLEWLALGGAKVTDAGLVHLKEMTKLKALSLFSTKITGTDKPDLVISSGIPTVTPSIVEPGKTVELSPWTVKIQGTAVSGKFSWGIYLFKTTQFGIPLVGHTHTSCWDTHTS